MLDLKDISCFKAEGKTIIIPPQYTSHDQFFKTLVSDFYKREGIDEESAYLLNLSITLDDSANDVHKIPEIYFQARITYYDAEESRKKTADFQIEEMPFRYYNDLLDRFQIVNRPERKDTCFKKDIYISRTYQEKGEAEPSEFTLYAIVRDQTEDSVTFDRYLKWGHVVSSKQVTFSREEFEVYYHRASQEEIEIFCPEDSIILDKYNDPDRDCSIENDSSGEIFPGGMEDYMEYDRDYEYDSYF